MIALVLQSIDKLGSMGDTAAMATVGQELIEK